MDCPACLVYWLIVLILLQSSYVREKQVSDGLWFGLGFLLVMFVPPPPSLLLLFTWFSHCDWELQMSWWAYVLFHAMCLCIPPRQLLPLQTLQPLLAKGVEPAGLVQVWAGSVDSWCLARRSGVEAPNCLPSGNKCVRVQSLLVNFDTMMMIWWTCQINRVDFACHL